MWQNNKNFSSTTGHSSPWLITGCGPSIAVTRSNFTDDN